MLRRLLYAVVLLVIAVPGRMWAEAGRAIVLDHDEQLFLDDYIIEQTSNVTRKVNAAQKHPDPVLKPQYPWEQNNVVIFGRAIYDQDEKIFKMWYYCAGSVAYATSEDGLKWDKPELDVVVRDGQRTNIVIERGAQIEQGIKGPFGYFYENFGVVKDHKDPDPARRYKLLFVSVDFKYDGALNLPPNSYTKYDPSQSRGLGLAVSADGIHWKLENDFVSHEICDISHFFWDDAANRFVLYGRNFIDKSDDRWVAAGMGRSVIRLESTDCRKWSAGELVLAADRQDPQDTEIYSMSVFRYEGIYIGLVQMYYAGPLQGNLEIQLACSRDGKNFTRVEPREPFIPEAPVGRWDRFNISVCDMPPVAIGDEQWFYYAGLNQRHPPYSGDDTSAERFAAIGLAKIKAGRLLSLESSFDGGTVLTKPIRFSGSQLSINANAAYGSIKVELVDDKGAPISGFEATVSGKDGIAIPVDWKRGALSKLADETIKIRFAIKNAQLYGFRNN